jgi:hypothetical protein
MVIVNLLSQGIPLEGTQYLGGHGSHPGARLMTELERAFDQDVWHATRECQKLGYHPIYTIRLMTERGRSVLPVRCWSVPQIASVSLVSTC